MKRVSKTAAYRSGLDEAILRNRNIADDPAEEQIISWLSDLWLLEGVPFYYLVPDQRMLPVESIRFFRVSENWLLSLLDGAFSIGRAVVGNAGSETFRFSHLHSKVKKLAGYKRARKLSMSMNSEASAMSGFLLRSAVVSGWPKMEVTATDSEGNPATILRFEMLSPDVMFCTFDRLVETVGFQEPSETLHFGIQQGTTVPKKQLKYVSTGPDGEEPGSEIENVTVDVTFRDPDAKNNVLDIDTLQQAIKNSLQKNHGIDPTAPYTPAEFTLEMIQGVQKVIYTVQTPA